MKLFTGYGYTYCGFCQLKCNESGSYWRPRVKRASLHHIIEQTCPNSSAASCCCVMTDGVMIAAHRWYRVTHAAVTAENDRGYKDDQQKHAEDSMFVWR